MPQPRRYEYAEVGHFGGKRRGAHFQPEPQADNEKEPITSQHLGEASIRTKHLSDLKEILINRLSERFDADLILKTLTLLSGKDLNVEVAVDGDAVAPWAVEEVAWFCEQVKKGEEQKLDEKALAKQVKTQAEAMHRALLSGLDIALSGRMATSGLMSELGKVDGAGRGLRYHYSPPSMLISTGSPLLTICRSWVLVIWIPKSFRAAFSTVTQVSISLNPRKSRQRITRESP
jgi:hypothetical protein